jgi:hypothetical protein
MGYERRAQHIFADGRAARDLPVVSSMRPRQDFAVLCTLASIFDLRAAAPTRAGAIFFFARYRVP